MKINLKPLLSAVVITGVVSMPGFANQADKAELNHINAQIAALQKEIAAIKAKKVARVHPTAIRNTNTAGKKKFLRDQIKAMADENNDYLPLDLDVPGQSFVSTGPYIGIPIQFAGSNLIINSPSINLDVQLLRVRKRIMKAQQAEGLLNDNDHAHSHLLLSGVVEGKATYERNDGKPSASDISLSGVGLTATVFGPSNWTTGFFELAYDDSGPNGIYNASQNYRVSNSRVYIANAFIVLGDFNQSPVYGTLGQFYAPFGTYSSVMVTDPMSKVIGRTKARAALVGFKMPGDNAWLGSIYAFRGDSRFAVANHINNGGVNLGYKFSHGDYSGNLGGGYIANVTDSAGMQSSAQFWNNESITRRVPAYNAHAMLSIGSHIDLIAEYVKTKSFNSNDMQFNGRSAQPWAIDTSASYSFMILDNKPSSVGIGYAQSGEALALGLPKQRYSMVFNTSLWRNTLQALELRREKDYNASATAMSASGINNVVGTGRYTNAITAQFDYFF